MIEFFSIYITSGTSYALQKDKDIQSDKHLKWVLPQNPELSLSNIKKEIEEIGIKP